MRKILAALVLSTGLGSAVAGGGASLDVMTQNQYFGGELGEVVAAAVATPFDPAAFNAAVVATLTMIADSRPTERVEALARQVLRRRPDVLGAQELYRFACAPYPGVPDEPGKGCDDPQIRAAFTDHLQDTAAALRGHYRVAAQAPRIDVQGLPFSINGHPALLSMTDRDAILVRNDLPAQWVDFAPVAPCRVAGQGCNFQTVPTLKAAFGDIVVERGFLAVDVRRHGRTFRVFNTHLEDRTLGGSAESRLLQVAQAYELLSVVLGTWDGARRVVVLGDINSDPRDTIPVPPYPATLPGDLPTLPPYRVLNTALSDVWLLAGHRDAGATCCQAADLRNRVPQLDQRIDMIFSLTPPSAVSDVELLGARPHDRVHLRGGTALWPSDHAALAARLHFDW